ncbi:zinc knuckle [Ancylostoma duodenale]|uniref:Zinc knuckle n=1 Tax=Ancylostoma duodenale TaxID=51022 RepID=A0A0C2CUY1_9BILA|nr:zinc knuckle [Ancylostoma duodenale]
MENESCPKRWIKCFHCGQMGHYSAVCDQPDVVKKIEEQIKEAAAEPKQTKEKIDAIRNKLGLDAFPGPTSASASYVRRPWSFRKWLYKGSTLHFWLYSRTVLFLCSTFDSNEYIR